MMSPKNAIDTLSPGIYFPELTVGVYIEKDNHLSKSPGFFAGDVKPGDKVFFRSGFHARVKLEPSSGGLYPFRETSFYLQPGESVSKVVLPLSGESSCDFYFSVTAIESLADNSDESDGVYRLKVTEDGGDQESICFEFGWTDGSEDSVLVSNLRVKCPPKTNVLINNLTAETVHFKVVEAAGESRREKAKPSDPRDFTDRTRALGGLKVCIASPEEPECEPAHGSIFEAGGTDYVEIIIDPEHQSSETFWRDH